MNSWFVDTSYWIAFLNEEDELHQRTADFNRQLKGVFITTPWVVTELLDGCRDRHSREKAMRLIRILQQQEDVIILQASEEWFLKGLDLYEKRFDKEWSLTTAFRS